MKKAHIWIIVLTILFSMATIVEAKDTYGYRTEYWEAFTHWSFSDSSTYIHVTKSDTSDIFPVWTEIYVTQSSPSKYFWYGSKSTIENIFNMDKQLDTATLSPVYIDMYDINRAFIKTIKIQVQWTGIDKIQNDDNVKLRNATATGSVNNTDMGQTNYAKLERYDGVYR